MERRGKQKNWGNRPWTIDFSAALHELPTEVDFAIVGGGFSGLSAAARLKSFAPEASVALFEADEFGAGSSGHTGGMALAESAVGDLPGLGDVLSGYQDILRDLGIDSELPCQAFMSWGARRLSLTHRFTGTILAHSRLLNPFPVARSIPVKWSADWHSPPGERAYCCSSIVALATPSFYSTLNC